MRKRMLTDFFAAVDDRIEKLNKEGTFCFQIRVRGQVIELRFTSRDHAEIAAQYLTGSVLEQKESPDAVFSYWTEDVTDYLPAGKEGETAVWQSRDETGFLRVTPDYGMSGIDYAREHYYFCRHPVDGVESYLYGHTMVILFSQWARRHSMFLLHSACVGVDGTGVMLSARSGEGKSTLAVACLLDGFDFVSDDYILVNEEGPLRAMPLYRTVGLNPDMAQVLDPKMPVIHIEVDRDDKLFLDASAYEFCEELPVKAIIHPHVSDQKEPEIRKVDPGSVLVKLIDSTAKQTGVFRDPEPYRQMAARLMGIPVYEILLCDDLEKNRTVLKNFIKKEIGRHV